MNAPAGKDLIKPLVEAMRTQGLRDGSEIPIVEKGAETGFLPGERAGEPADTVTLRLPVGKPGAEIPVIEIFLK